MNQRTDPNLVDDVLAELEKRRAAKVAAPRLTLGGYHEAAAVMGFFDPASLKAAAGARRERIEELLANSEPAVDAEGTPRWTLRHRVRVSTLRLLREEQRIWLALAANEPDPADLLRTTLEAYLRKAAEPIERQNRLQLAATDEVCGWLRAAGFEGLPASEEITARADWLGLLEPLEYIAGSFFRGRASELRDLRTYAGVLPPGSPLEATRRAVERVFSLNEKPPLLIYGPGGVGKSSLLTRFILEHAEALERDRFPFAYLDFDRPDIDASEPLTLLIEAVRQLGIEYPFARSSAEEIGRAWLASLADGKALRRARTAAVRDFATLIDSMGAGDRPVLLVLDTFEEVQYQSSEYVAAIFDLLEELQHRVTRLRVCIAGRGQLAKRKTQDLELKAFDQESAIAYLQARGINDAAVARRIFSEVGGSPLSLKLAAELVELEGLPDSSLGLPRRLIRTKDAVIQRQLYQRILGHIHDERVRRLAHPGLVLRRVTPELIYDVLAEPCGITLESLDDAGQLFEELRREVSLVTEESDGSLAHRQDLRLLMLKLLEADEPEKARWIRERAISFYERRSPNPADRAEEIYHRLVLGYDRAEIDLRWIPGVEPYLARALPELSGARRAYLGSRLGVEVDEDTWRQADLEDWELIAERKARELLAGELPENALRTLTERSDRTPTSPLFSLHAEALAQLARWGEALEVLRDGGRSALEYGDGRRALALLLQESEAILNSMRADLAGDVNERLEELTDDAVDLSERLSVAAHRLALGRLAPTVSEEERIELWRTFRLLFDEASIDVLTDDPTAARWAGSVFEHEDAARLARVVHATGLPRTDEHSLRALAAAIASFDLAASGARGDAPGVLARELGVPVGLTLTEPWGVYLLSESAPRVNAALCRVLELPDVPPEVVDGVTAVMRAALGVGRKGGRPNRDGITQPQSRARSLPAEQVERIVGALQSAFPSLGAVRELLRYRLDLSLDAIAPAEANLHDALEAVVRYAISQGYLEQLIVAAERATPGVTQVLRVAHELGLSTLPARVPEESALASASHIDASAWRTRLAQIEAQVCAIAMTGNQVGTGFLIGPDLVLTSSHVLPLRDIAQSVSEEDLTVSFDFATDASGRVIVPPTVFVVEQLVARSDSLDYALLRTAGSPGVYPVGGARTEATSDLRRWVELGFPPSPRLDRAAVVYMPFDQPCTLTTGSVLEVSDARVFGDFGTKPGASGAPVFNVDLEPVAMILGSEDRARDRIVAVSLRAIVDDLGRRGLDDLTGAVFA